METKKELKTLKGEKKLAENALNNASLKLESLEARALELENRLPSLQKRVIDAEVEKGRILERLVLNEASQDDLDKARELVVRSENEKAEAVELLGALEKGILGLNQSISGLKEQVTVAEKAIWAFLRDQELSNVKNETVRRAWAYQMKVGGGNWNFFLREIFGHYPDPKRDKEFQDVMIREHGLSE